MADLVLLALQRQLAGAEARGETERAKRIQNRITVRVASAKPLPAVEKPKPKQKADPKPDKHVPAVIAPAKRARLSVTSGAKKKAAPPVVEEVTPVADEPEAPVVESTPSENQETEE